MGERGGGGGGEEGRRGGGDGDGGVKRQFRENPHPVSVVRATIAAQRRESRALARPRHSNTGNNDTRRGHSR